MKTKLKNTKLIKTNSRLALLEEYPGDYEGSIDIVNAYWNEANSVGEFKRKVFGDERLINNRGYAQLSKESRKKHFLRTKSRLKQYEMIHAKSPHGLLKIGLNNGYIYIPNGARWNITRIYIIKANEAFNHHMHWYRFLMEGTLDIYSNEDIVKTLKGKYLVCGGDTFICFKEIDTFNEDIILKSIG